VASGLVALTLQSGPSGVFNLGSGAATIVSDIVELVRLHVAGNDNLIKIKQQRGKNATWADTRAMRSAFEWSPKISLAEGIEKTLL